MISFIKRTYRNLMGDKGFADILTGTVWAMISRVGTLVFSLASSLIIARLYGAEAMGILAIMVSVLSIATVFTVLGTGTSILRLIPEHLTKYSPTSAFRVYRKVQYLVAGVSVVTGLVLFLLSGLIAERVFKSPQLQGIIAVSAGFILFKSVMLLNQQAVRGLKLIRTFSFLQLLPAASFTLFLFVGISWKHDWVPAYAQLMAWAVTGILGAIIMDQSFRRRMQPDDSVEPMSTGSILSLSLPMLVSTSMTLVIGQTGIIILGMYRPPAEVGYYSLAVRLATLTAFVLHAINTMSAPTFSELYHQGQTQELLRIARKSTRLIFWTTIPILLILTVLGRPILALFRPEFVAAYPALLILVTGQFFHSLSGSTGLFMNMTGQQKALRNIMGGAALLNVVLNITLTPQIGLLGAAIAACSSTVFWNAAALILIYRKFGGSIAYVPFRSENLRRGQ